MVSVICMAYNHGKYIRRCLEGFVSQKTDFPFEVIIHDDASTDDTADIIREFAAKYPELIRPILQKENQYSRKVKFMSLFILPQVRGKYVALCEGDDFWTDETKLQRQVEAMEHNPECSLCVHKVAEVFQDGTPDGVVFPNFALSSGIVSSREFLEMGRYYSFHTSSFFFRTAEFCEYKLNPPEFVTKCSVGDEAYLLYFGQMGPVYYIDETMSCYRRGVEGSWTSRQLSDGGRATRHPRKMIDTYLSFDEYTGRKYHDLMVSRIARQMAIVVLLEKTSASMLKRENREYFRALSPQRRLFILAGAVFPGAVRSVYVRRLDRIAKNRGIG